MLRLELPFTDIYLLLSPRWSAWPLAGQTAALALCFLLPLVLILWLYRYELKLVRPLAALGLLILRLLVVFTLLFVVCLQPVVARTRSEELPGRVLLAVDASESMGVADPQRSPLDKLRLARALKIKLPGGQPADPLIEEWIKHYEANGEDVEVPWVRADEQANEADRLRLAEERRQLHDRLCEQVNRLSRFQIAQEILGGGSVSLVKSIRAKHHLGLFGFHEEAWDLPREDDPKIPAPVKGKRTDLGLPLMRALERSGKEEGKILGLVVLTDGQHNWAESPAAKALELGQHSLSVYPVALGARKPPPAVALVGMKAQSAVFKNVDVPVEARFKISGLPAQDFVVELKGADELLTEEIKHDGKDRYYTVSFKPRLTKAGTQSLLATIRPKEGKIFNDRGKPIRGDIRRDNNGQAVDVNVADDKAKVLLVDGEARWEFHYLHNALVRDPTVQLQSVVFEQPRLGKIGEDELKKTGNPARTLPSEPDGLASFDCIILGDVLPDQLPPPDRARLEKFVSDRGGTLVLVAGKRAMPLAYPIAEAPAATGETDPLAKLLPIQEARIASSTKGFPLQFTAAGKEAPFLQMDASSKKSQERWSGLPRPFWGVVGRAKPGAVSLAYLADENATGKKETPEKDAGRERALIVRQNYGFGRVLFVGLDSTWRWRYKAGDVHHHRFWGQVVRWAASDKPLVGGNEHVRFGTREAVFREKQEVAIVVRLAESTPLLGAKATAGARLLRKDGDTEEPVAVVPLERKEAQPRVLEGKVRDLPAGEYLIELAIPDLADKLTAPAGPDGKPGKLQARLSVASSDNQEMVELATNWPLLEELAAKSGGRVFSAEDAGELVNLLAKHAVRREEAVEHKLWQQGGVLLWFLVLLTAEWVGRKLAGLP